MKVRTWVDMGAEVDVVVDFNDVRAAISEACDRALGDLEGPNRYDVSKALNDIALFLRALSNEHINILSIQARTVFANFLLEQSWRFVGTVKPVSAEAE